MQYEDLINNDILALKKQEYHKKDTAKLVANSIDLNTASKESLCQLPGIGDKTAEKIIEYRKEHKFTETDDIKNVKGIGDKKYLKIKKYIKV